VKTGRFAAIGASIVLLSLIAPTTVGANPRGGSASVTSARTTTNVATSDIESFAEPIVNCTVAKQCYDQFATAVSLDAAGDLAVVGAWKWDSNFLEAGSSETGVAWVYTDTPTAGKSRLVSRARLHTGWASPSRRQVTAIPSLLRRSRAEVCGSTATRA